MDTHEKCVLRNVVVQAGKFRSDLMVYVLCTFPPPHRFRWITIGTLVLMNFLKIIINQGIYIEGYFFLIIYERKRALLSQNYTFLLVVQRTMFQKHVVSFLRFFLIVTENNTTHPTSYNFVKRNIKKNEMLLHLGISMLTLKKEF